MADDAERKIEEALSVLRDLDMPRAQYNERSALCLLSLLDLPPNRPWDAASAPLRGITPIMDWTREHYGKDYAPNTRETFRRQTMHQFVQAGIAVYNPDQPNRPVNSPHAVYQIEAECLALLRGFGGADYRRQLGEYLPRRQTLTARYARQREMLMVPITVADGREVTISPGAHSELIRAIWTDFGPRFVPGGRLVYIGDTGEKWGYFDEQLLASLGITVDNHGKMPDVVLHYPERNWLVLVEAVTSHGPVDGKRREELHSLFAGSAAGLVYVSAFPDQRTFTRYAEVVSWETEVWIADNPSHLIHYNGARFLGPYGS